MSYQFHQELSRVWENAVSLYCAGNSHADTFPIENDMPRLDSWGIKKIDIFDYAEDWCLYQEPDLLTFVLVHYERYSYFLEEQHGMFSQERINPAELPHKSEKVGGVVWLPRILPKARAKLRGELPSEVMYGCGGDRHFFQTNNIHPAEFLRITRRYMNDDQAIIQWVLNRKNSQT